MYVPRRLVWSLFIPMFFLGVVLGVLYPIKPSALVGLNVEAEEDARAGRGAETTQEDEAERKNEADTQARPWGPAPLASARWKNPWELDAALAESDPSRWEQLLRLYYAGELEQAASLLGAMLAEGFDEGTVRRELAVVYKDLGEYQRAAAEYEQLAKLFPGDAQIWGDWGFVLLSLGDSAGAMAKFREAALHDPKEPLFHYGLALAHYVQGEHEPAAQALRQATALAENFAAPYELLGTLYLEEGRFHDAASALYRALRLDSSLLMAYYRLARAYEGDGRIQEAWSYYDRARRIFSTHQGVQQDVARFVETHRATVMAQEQARVEARQRASHMRVEPLAVPPETPVIRVGLLEGARDFTFSAGADFLLEAAGGEEPLAAAGVYPGGEWRVVLTDRGMTLTSSQGERVELPRRDVRLTPVDPAATMILYDLETGQGYFWSTREDLQVRGSLEFLARERGITVVNVLDIESYLLAVVPSEMYPTMELEALKAQAIAARTYTLRSRGRYSSRGFDVLATVASSAYRGVAREHPATTQAVLETMGQVLTYQGSLAETVYTSNAGGFTAASADVWGGARPYLVGVPEWGAGEDGPAFPLSPSALESWLMGIPDVYSSRSRLGLLHTFRWVYRVDAQEIDRRVGRVAPIGRVLRIIPGQRGMGGYVNRVTVVGTAGVHTLQGDAIRSLLGGLKSTAFKVQPVVGPDGTPQSFLFFGGGFGHGVGLSQFGAAGMAEAGATAGEILMHYFPGTTLSANYNR